MAGVGLVGQPATGMPGSKEESGSVGWASLLVDVCNHALDLKIPKNIDGAVDYFEQLVSKELDKQLFKPLDTEIETFGKKVDEFVDGLPELSTTELADKVTKFLVDLDVAPDHWTFRWAMRYFMNNLNACIMRQVTENLKKLPKLASQVPETSQVTEENITLEDWKTKASPFQSRPMPNDMGSHSEIAKGQTVLPIVFIILVIATSTDTHYHQGLAPIYSSSHSIVNSTGIKHTCQLIYQLHYHMSKSAAHSTSANVVTSQLLVIPHPPRPLTPRLTGSASEQTQKCSSLATP